MRHTQTLLHKTIIGFLVLAILLNVTGLSLNADVLNDSVTVPDHPGTTSFNPTSIKDIKAADPGANITLIEPPQISNTGDARLTFPIEVPPGRNGMQPDLNLIYNSSASNGLIGIGWDLPVPAIMVETRWGVPRYSEAKETETYLLNGEQLTPVVHRTEFEDRIGDQKVFHTRVEGQFRRITRYGDNPTNYRWVVEDKNGIRYFYGSEPGSNSHFTLDDNGDMPDGNIFRWALREVRDLNGNGINYEYDLVQNNGLANGSVPGYQLYLRAINYTQSNGAPGAYTITFMRDSQLPNYTPRPDVMIDARGGFKMVTAELLKRIDIDYNGQPIRSYEFDYIEGAFAKTLLRAISQYGEDGTLFHEPHIFTYDHEIWQDDGSYDGFTEFDESWETNQEDNDVQMENGVAGILQTFIDDFGSATSLGSSESEDFGFHLFLGFNPWNPNKSTAIGGKGGFSHSENDIAFTLIDLNGDNLPDRVYRKGETIYFQMNLSGPGHPETFSDSFEIIEELDSIGHESSNTFSFGGELYALVANAFINNAESDTESDRYFSDVNGDGLPDFVNDGEVLFNYLDVNGIPTFSPNSFDTPVPITSDVSIDGSALIDQLNDSFETKKEQFPLVDTLLRWEAPLDGVVSITGTITLSQTNTITRTIYETADGVRVAIQLEGTELWSQEIGADDYSTYLPDPNAVESVNIQQGQHLYFRVQSQFDGQYDQVNWVPEIRYINTLTVTDVNLLDPYRYNAQEDFTLAGQRGIFIQMPVTGTIKITGDVQKLGITTDDVTLVICRADDEVEITCDNSQLISSPGDQLDWNQTGVIQVDETISVNQLDKILLRLQVDSHIDVTQLQWTPEIVYTEVTGEDNVALVPAPVDENGDFIFKINPPYDIDFYPLAVGTPLASFQNPQSATYHVRASLNTLQSFPNEEVVFTIKKPGELIEKQTMPFTGNSATLEFDVALPANSQIYFAFSSINTEFLSQITAQSVTIEGPGFPTPTLMPSAIYGVREPGRFSQSYRGWGAAGYNGNDRTSLPIIEQDLEVEFDENTNIPDPVDPGDTDGIGNLQDELEGILKDAKAYSFYPSPKDNRWNGPDDFTFYSPEQVSSSRLGPDFFKEPEPGDFAGARGVVKRSSTNNLAYGFGGNIPLPISLSANYSQSDSDSNGDIDSFDMNGDWFPDIVSSNSIQYTVPTGDLEDGSQNITLNSNDADVRFRESENDVWTLGIGGNGAFSVGNPEGEHQTAGRSGIDTSNETGNQMVTVGLSGSLGSSSSAIQNDLTDLNGDGLPDYVEFGANGNGDLELRVAFNLGYKFAPLETWEISNDVAINKGHSENGEIGGSIGYNDGIYGFGGGASLNHGMSTAEKSLIDINGDGLLDLILFFDETNPIAPNTIMVGFNTGNGFATPVAWSGNLTDACINDSLDSTVREGLNSIALFGDAFEPLPWDETKVCDSSTGFGGGLYFTIGISVCFGGCYIIINPGGDYGASYSVSEAAFRDVNGDSYPDHVASQRLSEMRYAKNNTGTTNLLKRVDRPLGASFELEYERDGNTYDQPQSSWVLSKVTVFDGHVDGDPESIGVDNLVTTYRYENGYYDRLEREFYGYRKVIEEHRDASSGEALYRYIEREFLNDNYYAKGLLRREMSFDAAGNPFTETENFYQLRDIQSGERLTATQQLTTTATVFPELTWTSQRYYEGQPMPGKQTTMIYVYDALGNITNYVDTGDVSPDDDIWATLAYSSCDDTYVVGTPISIRVESNEGLMRHRQAEVDCASGDVTQVRQYLLNGDAAITDLAYFANGNLRQVTGPENLIGQRYQLTYEYDPVVQTHVTLISDSFGYSSTASHNYKYGVVATTTDLNNNQISYVYDAFGRVENITGPYEQGTGHLTIQFEYHPEAEVPYAITRHIDKEVIYDEIFENYRFEYLSDTIDTVLFIDGLKRVIQTKKDAAIHTNDTVLPTDKIVASGRVIFDFVGRTIAQYYPVEEPLGTPDIFNPTYDSIQPTVTTYDVLDRVTTVTIPDNTSTTMAYDFGPDRNGMVQFRTTVTDANGIQKASYTDVREQIVSVQEFNTITDTMGTQVVQEIWTSYAYDPLQQIVQVRDNHSNVTTVLYDNFGRRTEINNPDIGRVTTVYDLASNVIAKITPNLRSESEEITYEYDFNRLAAINYPDFPGNDVHYTYGGPGADFNRAGRIAIVTDQSGAEQRFYGQLGEITQSIKTVLRDRRSDDDEFPLPMEYTTHYTYDTWGRLHMMVYPEGPEGEVETLQYKYDSGGQVAAAIGRIVTGSDSNRNNYVLRLEYDKFEQRVFMQMGNGVVTHYDYDPLDRRLATLAAGQSDAAPFQNLRYTYDDVGNVLSLTNDVSLPQASQPQLFTYNAFTAVQRVPHVGYSEQHFAYDDLYRLTSAAGSYQFTDNVTDQYQLTMNYDTIHNITYKDQRHEVVFAFPPQTVVQEKTTYEWLYHYDAAQPHAPSLIEQNLQGWEEHRTYTYDTNGNQDGYFDHRTSELRHVVWDEENRIQSIHDDHQETNFKYNDAGERVLKQSDEGFTAYVNQFHTNRNEEQGTNHIFIGTTRIAASTMVVAPEDDNEFFYHPNHLGSTHYVTNEAGEIYEHLEYFPFGETWVEEWTEQDNRLPYRFTSKELDEETGLYYFGARYYDPRTSVWQSADPILEQYLDEKFNNGVFMPVNLAMYSYSYQNPIRYFDPNGQKPDRGDFTPDYKPEITETVPSLDRLRGERKREIDLIIVHGTGTPKKAIDTRTGSQVVRNMESHKASVHYVIDRKGRIIQSVPESSRANHAGVSEFKGEGGVNDRSIGIELIHPNDPNVSFTREQMNALEGLLVDIIVRRNVPVENIVGHRDVAPDRKPNDPTLNFDSLRKSINERMQD